MQDAALSVVYRSSALTQMSRRLPATKPATRRELVRRLQHARDFMRSGVGGSLSLAVIAREACLSPFHFHRSFRSCFGETPHQFVVRLRLDRAAARLRRTDSSVTDIAMAVGFETPAHFSRASRDALLLTSGVSQGVRLLSRATPSDTLYFGREPRVDGERAFNQAIDAEVLGDPLAAGVAYDLRSAGSFSSVMIAAGKILRICRLDQQPGFVVNDRLGNAAGLVPTTARFIAIASSTVEPRPSVIELITKRSADFTSCSTSSRKPASITCLSRCSLLDLPLERRPQLAFAEDDQVRVRHLAQHVRHRVDQVFLSLVTDQRADIRQHRRAVRQPVLRVNIDGRASCDLRRRRCRRARRRCGPLGCRRARGRADGVGRRDEQVHLPVLPPRERVRLQMEVDAARGDDRRPRVGRAERQRQRRHRDGVGIVRVHDLPASTAG